ncbi:GH32 C-terminal domain-containing protein [Propioniciclava flava]
MAACVNALGWSSVAPARWLRTCLGSWGHAEVPVAGLAGSRAFRLTLQVEAEAGGSWRVRLGEAERHVDLEFADGCLTVDRRSTRYPHGERRVVRLPAVTGVLDVEVVHDRSVTEIFVADGALAFSLRSYLDGASGVSMASEGRLRIASVQAHRFD